MLGPGNEEAAREALREWPGGLQVGGGLNEGNVREWIESGAKQVGRDFCRRVEIGRQGGRRGVGVNVRSGCIA